MTFTAEWTDPSSAYDLVVGVQSFLDGGNAAEVSIIADAISLLEEHARGERDGIDTAMEEFIHLKDGMEDRGTRGDTRRRGASRLSGSQTGR